MASVEELESRVRLLEDQVRLLLDQHRRLDVMQIAMDNHTQKLGRIEESVELNGAQLGQLIDQNASTHRQLADIIRRLDER